jgi:hypothetical protein
LQAARQQRGDGDGAPAATADGIDQAGDGPGRAGAARDVQALAATGGMPRASSRPDEVTPKAIPRAPSTSWARAPTAMNASSSLKRVGKHGGGRAVYAAADPAPEMSSGHNDMPTDVFPAKALMPTIVEQT